MRVSVYSSIAGAPLCKEDCTYPWFDDPTLEKVFSFIREIHRYTPPGLSFNPDEPQVYHQLSLGVTAYQVAANWHVNYARENDAVDDVQYGLIPMPDDGGDFVATVNIGVGQHRRRPSVQFGDDVTAVIALLAL